MRRADQDISNYSLLKSNTLTFGFSPLKKAHIPCIFLGSIPMWRSGKKATNNDEMQVLCYVMFCYVTLRYVVNWH